MIDPNCDNGDITVKKDLFVWQNSSNMMFISWTEQHDSVIDPNEPGNLEAMASIIGVTVEDVWAAVSKAVKTEQNNLTDEEE